MNRFPFKTEGEVVDVSPRLESWEIDAHHKVEARFMLPHIGVIHKAYVV